MAARTPAKVDLAHYQDKYHEKLSALIEAKVAGKQIVALPNEQVKVLNLMEALKRSVAEAQDVQSKELPPTRRMPKKPVNGKSKRVGRAKKLAISARELGLPYLNRWCVGALRGHFFLANGTLARLHPADAGRRKHTL